jgi:hypothetical protein
VSLARGEQDYYNGADNIPTATEGCKSNALMRCCKDLGIASELWDPNYILWWKNKFASVEWVAGSGLSGGKKCVAPPLVHALWSPSVLIRGNVVCDFLLVLIGMLVLQESGLEEEAAGRMDTHLAVPLACPTGPNVLLDLLCPTSPHRIHP